MAMGFVPVAAENPQLDKDIDLFHTRCSKCHEYTRIIDLDIVIPSVVEDSVDRMAAKENSNIQSDEKKPIYQAILYNAYVNKLDVLKKSLDALPPEQKSKEIEALKTAMQSYK
jgi:hypothetical protein